MKRIPLLSVVLIILVFMIHGNDLGAKAVLKIKVGDTLPDVQLPVPENSSHRKYLGLTGEGFFGIQDIKAKVVIIQFFQWN